MVFGDALAAAVASGATIDLNSADASDQRVVIDGVSTTQGACDVASSAGDVDGDGKADLLLATRRSSGTARLRQVHVVFGAALAAARDTGDRIRLDDAVAKGQAVLFDPIDDVGIVQFSVSSLGDIDEDGFDDILPGDRAPWPPRPASSRSPPGTSMAMGWSTS